MRQSKLFSVEWVIASAFAIVFIISTVIFLTKKLLAFAPKVKALRELSEQVEKASEQVAELEATVSAISEDPMVHEARRVELLRKKRQLKRDRERRLKLRFRDF